MHYVRCDNLNAFIAAAIAYQTKWDRVIWAEPHIYTDDNGLSFRPSICLLSEDSLDDIPFTPIMMRWFAYHNEPEGGIQVQHMGKRMRVEAREEAERMVEFVQMALNTANKG